jgi:hypothetical protein
MPPQPKLHNAMWPGLVGKGGPGGEPPIDLDTMLDLTAKAQVDGTRFGGVDLFLFDPHVSIDSSNDDLQRLAEKISGKNLMVGSVVAPVWPPTGGGSAMGSEEERKAFLVPGTQGVLDRAQARGLRRPPLRRCPHRLGQQPRRLGQGSCRQYPEDCRHHSPRPPTSRSRPVNDSRSRGRFAGAACRA